MTDAPDPATSRLVPLPGSERRPARDAFAAPAALDGEEGVQATLVLRRSAGPDDAGGPAGADPADVALVRTTLEALGLSVTAVHEPSRRVRIAGSVAAAERAFGTSLRSVTSTAPDGARVRHRERTGVLHVPAALDGVVTAVLGLDDRPQVRAQTRFAPAAVTTGYTPPELGTIYDFPAGTDGTGGTIAIVELGGGYAQSDLDAYFGGLGLATAPTVTAVSVDGAQNTPGGDPQGADGEVLLDIEVAGALAPGAALRVLFAPNTDAGFLDAVAEAAHAAPAPVAISISWGQDEDEWTAQARTALDEAMEDAVRLGATVTAAAGDGGSSDGASGGAAHADFPASSPHALACGGTTLRASGGAVQSETVWNDGAGGATGGGVSDVFPLPAWQQGAGVPAPAGGSGGRGVPDVAAVADPRTGYRVLVDGTRTVIGGTSAVAPLWAALVARLAQALDAPLGLLQPRIYGAASAFRDITEGDNGAFAAGPGWDPCTGLGTPRGSALLDALRG